MKKFVLPILMILSVIGGVTAADFVKNRPADNAPHKKETSGKKAKHDDKKKQAKSGKKKGDKGKHGDSAYNTGELSYLKFKRQFVVPVMVKGRIDALVIMNLNLVLDDAAPANSYSYEPKLRDALTRELLVLSNDGMFGDGLTTADNYEAVRSRLLAASKSVLPEGLTDILILDIARQEH